MLSFSIKTFTPTIKTFTTYNGSSIKCCILNAMNYEKRKNGNRYNLMNSVNKFDVMKVKSNNLPNLCINRCIFFDICFISKLLWKSQINNCFEKKNSKINGLFFSIHPKQCDSTNYLLDQLFRKQNIPPSES